MSETNGSSTPGFQFSTRIKSKKTGASHLVVWRTIPSGDGPDRDIKNLFDAMQSFEAAAEKNGYVPLSNSYSGQDIVSYPIGEAPEQPRQPRQPSQPSQPSQPESSGSGLSGGGVSQATREKYPNHTSLGVGTLTKVVIDDMGQGKIRVGFVMSNRSKPMYDNRGPEIVASEVFGSNNFEYGDFKAECLSKPDTMWTPKDWGDKKLYVLSGKGERFWDVLSVLPG